MLVKIAFLAGLVVAATASNTLWEKFKVEHSKTYSNDAEHQLRQSIFLKNLKNIEEHNAKYEKGWVSWYMAINQFSDVTPEEFEQMLRAQVFNYTTPEIAEKHTPTGIKTPSSIDWRTKGAVTAVKNQGDCGSCWTFSATGSLEGAYAIKTGTLVSLSEQHFLDCCTEDAGYHGDGCDGGVIQSALQYAVDNGIDSESDYPYEVAQKTCRQVPTVFKAAGYKNVNNENDLKDAVGNVGPVSVALNADKFQFYGGGIFSDSCDTAVNHGVLAVGYGTENGVDYWIIKNTWGPSFGEAGYIRMIYGRNICGLASYACYPYL